MEQFTREKTTELTLIGSVKDFFAYRVLHRRERVK